MVVVVETTGSKDGAAAPPEPDDNGPLVGQWRVAPMPRLAEAAFEAGANKEESAGK